jgi:Amidohydrolase family
MQCRTSVIFYSRVKPIIAILRERIPFHMKPHLWIVAALLLLISCRSSITSDILIQNVNIIDLETGVVNYNQDVVITANVISSITDHGTAKVDALRVIGGQDKFLMPGLWDMHAHMLRDDWYESQMPLMRANGITGFREMWGDLNVAKEVKTKMLRDSLPYFRFVAAGHIVDGKKPFWRRSLSVKSSEEAIRVVDSLKDAGADFIKVYSFLDSVVLNAIAKRSKEKSIPFAGHVPHSVKLTDASKAGMASMEHLYGFLTEACSDSESAALLMKESVAAFESGDTKERKRIASSYHSLVLKNFDKNKLIEMCAVLKENNTHIVPTLVTLKGIYFINDTTFTSDPRKRYLSDVTLEYWRETEMGDIKNNSTQDWIDKRRRWETEKEIMRTLIEEKVTIMAGTDCDNPYAFPGFGLHDELAMYVELGMTPLDALRSATTIPIRFLGLSDTLGAVSKGKIADLLLLDANPLVDITNASRIHAVFANGSVYDSQWIDSALEKAARKR